MGNNPAIFQTKALVIRTVLEGQLLGNQFPFSGCHSKRELDIQVAKLERMLAVFVKKFRPEAAALKTSAERKAFRRKIGPEIAKLDQQAKKMDGLFYKTIEEAYFQAPRQESRTQFRKALVAVSRNFEKIVYDGAQAVQKRISAASGQKHLKP